MKNYVISSASTDERQHQGQDRSEGDPTRRKDEIRTHHHQLKSAGVGSSA